MKDKLKERVVKIAADDAGSGAGPGAGPDESGKPEEGGK